MADYTGPATHLVAGEREPQPRDPLSGDASSVHGSYWTVSSLLRRLVGPILCLLGAAVLVACVGDAPAVDGSDAGLVQGRELYINNCIGCHGSDGGGGTGPKLNEGIAEANYPDIASQIRLVAEGKDQMPSFSAKLSAAEIEAVTRYTREGL